MSVINILSPHVADLIAAGEVVERPASVIKELVENAFDAGAKNILVEIRNGGATYIRVTDDGCGMSPEDAGIAFLRHATSKLSGEEGLEHIGTMGFRGEALAAISSVCHMEITTKQHDAPEGVCVYVDAGEITEMVSCGCPDGTTMICRDLFFNTPARMKFMKSDRSEASACVQVGLRCALGRPDVSVRFVKDGNEEFFTPGDGRMDSCVFALLGREEARSMLPVLGTRESLRLEGFISSPSQGHGNRSHQFFFVNGRYIKSQLLQSALEQAYRNTLLVGRYPGCVLYLTVPFSDVDVNVHPAKTEVRFMNEKVVFDFLYQSALLSLQNENRSTSVSDADEISPVPPVQEKKTVPSVTPAVDSPFLKDIPSHAEQLRIDLDEKYTDNASSVNSQPAVQNKVADTPRHFTQNDFTPFADAHSDRFVDKNVENYVQNVEKPAIPEHKILGEAFKTYIIVEQNGEILLIDKHAAHERLVFDRLKSETDEISSQLLITPATIRLDHEYSVVLEQNGEALSDLGFEIEPYGDNEYIIRGIPGDLEPAQAVPAVEEILDKLKNYKDVSAENARDEVLHTVACKAAIKAGWDTDRFELSKLVDKVLCGEIKYCPHGRPVSIVVTRRDLDRLFKRIV